MDTYNGRNTNFHKYFDKPNIIAEVDVKHYCKKVKRYRSAFTTGQINYLEEQFKKCPYIGNTSRKEVASVLNISERAIKIWFQNRRMKEKKEVINKDCNLDRQNTSIQNIDLSNDSLNNVHSLQSTNDRQRSLPTAVSTNIKEINCINYNDDVHSKSTNIQSLENLKRDTLKYERECKFNKNTIANNNDCKSNCKPVAPIQATTSSKNKLNRVYNNKLFMNYLEKNCNEGADPNKASGQKLDSKIWSHEIQSTPIPAYQDLPQDLSARNNSNSIIQHNHQENVSLNAAYFPFCATQNLFTPCVSAGNVIWKPVNVMPFASPTSFPLAVPDNHLSGIPHINNVQKIECNCKCHIKSFTSIHQSKINSQPQYVIALPYNQNTSQ